MAWHGMPARGWRRARRSPDSSVLYEDCHRDRHPDDIVACVAEDVSAGLTARQIADKRRLPVDFVDMAIDRARERGLLEVVDMGSSGHACGESICRPDPDSLVCAGCPFRIFPSSRS